MLLFTCCSGCGGVQPKPSPSAAGSLSGPVARKSEQDERKAQNLPARQPLRLLQQVAFFQDTCSWDENKFASSIHQEDIIYNLKSLQSCLTLRPYGCRSLPGFSVLGFSRQEFRSGLPFTMLTSFQKSEVRIALASCRPLCQEGRGGSVKPCAPWGAVDATGESSQQKVPAGPGFIFRRTFLYPKWA